MKNFRVVRKDIYIVEVEAESEEEARKKCETDDTYLNGGSFCECVFGDIMEE